MADLLVRRLDANIKDRLRRRAARNGRSMEAEARQILEASLSAEPDGTPHTSGEGFGTRLGRLFDGVNVDLEPYIRQIRGQAPRAAKFDGE